MKTETTTLKSRSDGLEISVMLNEPDGREKPHGIVQLVHGMCEYKERYIPFMEFLTENGYVCVIHDHRGHGKSVRNTGELGYFYEGGYMGMLSDIKMVTDWIRERHPGLPLILMGHSMGSMAVRSFTKRYDTETDGLIVCGSPSYNSGAAIGKLLACLYTMVKGRMFRPKFIQAIAFGAFNRRFRQEGSGNAWICSDPEIVSAYDADPYCTFQFTADGFLNLFSLMQDAYSRKGWKTGNPGMPVLFISGTDDPCMLSERKFRKSVDRMKEAGYRNTEWKLYRGMRHEILNEKDRETVWSDVLGFCNKICYGRPMEQPDKAPNENKPLKQQE